MATVDDARRAAGGAGGKDAEVLVVHCVDAEGPLGGNARRLPDGSPEFMDSWD